VSEEEFGNENVIQPLRIKFDSACSKCMSGVPGRISDPSEPDTTIKIYGFNNSNSMVSQVGINDDGKEEFYVPTMPTDLVLLSSYSYASEGAAVLFPEDGAVYKLNETQREELIDFLQKFPKITALKVVNRTYEVAQSTQEFAHSSTATKYFNSKVHVSNTTERILATLLTGLSFSDLYSMKENGSVEGIPRDITMETLNTFSRKYGRTPDVVQLARPNLAGNTKGYMAAPPQLTHVGQRVEADFFTTDFNYDVKEPNGRIKSSKIPTLGGATFGFVSVDAYSGFVHGRLTNSTANAVEHVKWVNDLYSTFDHTIDLFAGDKGIIGESSYQVMTPSTQKYLNENNILFEVAEPYCHNHGGAYIEEVIKSIKELIRFGIYYILKNPNFKESKFTTFQIYQLWGELFYWAISVINLKSCPKNSTVTKYFVFYGNKPDLRNIRLLPIFSFLMVLRRSGNDLQSKRDFWQRGLYVGPSQSVKGAVRVAVLTNGKVKIITSTAIKCISDGGDINPYKHVDHFLQQELNSVPHQEDITPVSHGDSDDAEIASLQGRVPSLNSNSTNADHTAQTELGGVNTREESKEDYEQIREESEEDYEQIIPGIPNISSKKSPIHVATTSKNQEIYDQNIKKWGTRAERYAKRIHTASELIAALSMESYKKENITPTTKPTTTALNMDFEECLFIDWTTHDEDSYYLDLGSNQIIFFENMMEENSGKNEILLSEVSEFSARAVTTGVPKISYKLWQIQFGEMRLDWSLKPLRQFQAVWYQFTPTLQKRT